MERKVKLTYFGDNINLSGFISSEDENVMKSYVISTLKAFSNIIVADFIWYVECVTGNSDGSSATTSMITSNSASLLSRSTSLIVMVVGFLWFSSIS